MIVPDGNVLPGCKTVVVKDPRRVGIKYLLVVNIFQVRDSLNFSHKILKNYIC